MKLPNSLKLIKDLPTVGAVVLLIVLAVSVLFLEGYTGFIFLLVFAVAAMFRSTKIWQNTGVEFHYFFIVFFSFYLSPMYVLPLLYVVLFVLPRFQPEELIGSVIHSVIFTGLALTVMFAGSAAIFSGSFLIMGVTFVVLWRLIDLALTVLIAPVPLPTALFVATIDMVFTSYLIYRVAPMLIEVFGKI